MRFFILVPDSVELKDTERYKNYFAAAYKKDSKAFRKEVDLHLHEQLNSADSTHAPVYISTQSNIYDDTIGSSAMYIFLGLYLGISFLISGRRFWH